jgi:hypothetical protein
MFHGLADLFSSFFLREPFTALNLLAVQTAGSPAVLHPAAYQEISARTAADTMAARQNIQFRKRLL